jgi:hypothetical protein
MIGSDRLTQRKLRISRRKGRPTPTPTHCPEAAGVLREQIKMAGRDDNDTLVALVRHLVQNRSIDKGHP